ncbi:MAG: serine--tRNA ligase, partial [Oxalobacter sp.]|nr:serine--tRNA ligase [Oxalobacter sp.]
MIDIQLLRKDIASVAAKLKTRNFDLDIAAFNEMEATRRQLQTETEDMQAKRNTLSKQIGALKKSGQDASAIMAEVGGIGAKLKANEAALTELQEKISAFMLAIPNIPHESVPVGVDEAANVEVRRVGTPRTFDFEVKDHVDVGTPLGLDFETAAKLSGARFCLMRGNMARLHRALAQFMLDTQT